MAEIDIERKRKQSSWPWALAALLLLLVIGMTWYLAGPETDRGNVPDLMRRDSVTAPGTTSPPPETGRPPAVPGTQRP